MYCTQSKFAMRFSNHGWIVNSWLARWKLGHHPTNPPGPFTPGAGLKVEPHHPSRQRRPNVERRIALDALMDAASPSALASLAR